MDVFSHIILATVVIVLIGTLITIRCQEKNKRIAEEKRKQTKEEFEFIATTDGTIKVYDKNTLQIYNLIDNQGLVPEKNKDGSFKKYNK